MDSAKPKGGRPKKPVKRESVTGVRFTETEYSVVKNKAAAAGLKLTVYIRNMALSGHVFARLSVEEKQQIKSLSGMANNINQMAHKAHAEGLLKAAASFSDLLSRLEDILKHVQP